MGLAENDGLYRRDWLMEAFRRHDASELFSPAKCVVLAIDPARFGADSSVGAIAQGGFIH